MSEQWVSGEGIETADVMDSASSITGVGKGKRAATIVYTSRKHARGQGVRHQHEPAPFAVQSD